MAQEKTPQRRGWIYGVTALVALIVLIFWLRSALRDKVVITEAKASYQNILSTESTNGVVVPLNDFQAYAGAPGTISKILVKVGQHVTKGQELVQMDNSSALSQLASANSTLASSLATLQNMKAGGTQGERITQDADIRAAQAQVTRDQAQLATEQTLMAKGAASANEVESARERLQSDQAHLSELQRERTGRYGAADLRAQEAQVATAKEGVAAAQAAMAGVDIRAPFDGTVYSIPFSPHDFVPTDKALLNMADLSKLIVKAYFDEPEIGPLRTGESVTITWDAKPDRVWHGHIEQVPTTVIEYGTRHVGECVISVDDASGDLLPYTNVTVTVTTNDKDHVLSIPREALHTQNDNNYVFKVVNGHLHKTPVTVGALNLTLVEVTSGLNDGDTVALGSTSEAELIDGLEVKAQP